MRLTFFKKRGDRALDPGCDMQVAGNRPPGGSHKYKGETYYFCGPGCNRVFQKEPEAYLSGKKMMEM